MRCLYFGALVNGNHDGLLKLREIARSKDDQQMLLNLVLFTKGADDVRLCIETLSPAGQSGLVYLSANGHALHAEAKRICLEHLGRRHARHRCAPRPCCSASPTPTWHATTGPRTLLKEQYLFDKGDAAVLSHTQERPEEDHDDDSSDGQAEDDAGADEWAPRQEARSDAHRARARQPQPQRGFDGRRRRRRGG